MCIVWINVTSYRLKRCSLAVFLNFVLRFGFVRISLTEKTERKKAKKNAFNMKRSEKIKENGPFRRQSLQIIGSFKKYSLFFHSNKNNLHKRLAIVKTVLTDKRLSIFTWFSLRKNILSIFCIKRTDRKFCVAVNVTNLHYHRVGCRQQRQINSSNFVWRLRQSPQRILNRNMVKRMPSTMLFLFHSDFIQMMWKIYSFRCFWCVKLLHRNKYAN